MQRRIKQKQCLHLCQNLPFLRLQFFDFPLFIGTDGMRLVDGTLPGFWVQSGWMRGYRDQTALPRRIIVFFTPFTLTTRLTRRIRTRRRKFGRTIFVRPAFGILIFGRTADSWIRLGAPQPFINRHSFIQIYHSRNFRCRSLGTFDWACLLYTSDAADE